MGALRDEILDYARSVAPREIRKGSCIVGLHGDEGRRALADLVADGLLLWDEDTGSWALPAEGA